MAPSIRAAVPDHLVVDQNDEPIVVPWQRGASRQAADSRQAASNEEFAVPWQLPRKGISQGVKDHEQPPVTVVKARQGATAA